MIDKGKDITMVCGDRGDQEVVVQVSATRIAESISAGLRDVSFSPEELARKIAYELKTCREEDWREFLMELDRHLLPDMSDGTFSPDTPFLGSTIREEVSRFFEESGLKDAMYLPNHIGFALAAFYKGIFSRESAKRFIELGARIFHEFCEVQDKAMKEAEEKAISAEQAKEKVGEAIASLTKLDSQPR